MLNDNRALCCAKPTGLHVQARHIAQIWHAIVSAFAPLVLHGCRQAPEAASPCSHQLIAADLPG